LRSERHLHQRCLALVICLGTVAHSVAREEPTLGLVIPAPRTMTLQLIVEVESTSSYIAFAIKACVLASLNSFRALASGASSRYLHTATFNTQMRC
jgi:hypothetical protein